MCDVRSGLSIADRAAEKETVYSTAVTGVPARTQLSTHPCSVRESVSISNGARASTRAAGEFGRGPPAGSGLVYLGNLCHLTVVLALDWKCTANK